MGRHGENIRKRKDGRWEARVIDSYFPDGKAHYRYLYGKSYQEVKNKKKHLIGILQISTTTLPRETDKEKMTFQELADQWIHYKKGTVKESTLVNYMNLIEKHLLPEIGPMHLSAITTDYLDQFLHHKLDVGRLDGKGGLSPKTVADLRSILIMIIEYAHSRQYLCPVNRKVFYPKNLRSDMQVLSRSEQKKLEEYLFSSPEPFACGVLLALYSGIRIGELCALKWGDINFSDGTLHVGKTLMRIKDISSNSSKKTKIVIDYPKTETSLRTIPIPSFVLKHLKKHSSNPEDYLLTGSTNFYEPRSCLIKYKKILQKAGVEEYTFHTLRHTFATRCVESNFDTKSLSEILGHANVSTTLQRYVHPSMELKRSQMERLEMFSIHGQKNSQESACES